MPVDERLDVGVAFHVLQDGLEAAGGVAQGAGHADVVAVPRGAAQARRPGGAFAEHGHVEADAVWRSGGVAAQQGDAEPP